MAFCSHIAITIYADTEEELRELLERTPISSRPVFDPTPVGNRFMMRWLEEPVLEPPKRTVKEERKVWAAGGFLSPITRSRE